jgi:hypothetical protein
LFEQTWQRPPTPQELEALIQDHVREEVYNRQARKLGLDIDDAVIRRRLRTKMEFFDENAAGLATPTEQQLEQYLQQHAARFEMEPQMAFRQVFLNSGNRGAGAWQDAAELLQLLNGENDADPSMLGDSTLLPFDQPLAGKSRIAADLGTGFADALAMAPQGVWSGPVESAYGLHLVFVTERMQGQSPALAQVRESVLREWTNAQRNAVLEERYREYLSQYSVAVERPGR